MTSETGNKLRVKICDGRPQKYGQIKAKLGSYLKVIDDKGGVEFVIIAETAAQIEDVRGKLAAIGLDEIPNGPTDVSMPTPKQPMNLGANRGRTGGQWSAGQKTFSLPLLQGSQQNSQTKPLQNKPYGFVSLPETSVTDPPVWHDGSDNEGKLSGEIRCELETLTPLLVGWERRKINEENGPWYISRTPVQGKDVDEFIWRGAIQTYPDNQDEKKRRQVENSRSSYFTSRRDHVVRLDIGKAGHSIDNKSGTCQRL